MIQKFKRMAVSVFLLLVPAMIMALPAKAATGDDEFLTAVHARGIISTGGDSGLIELAHKICVVRTDGLSEDQVIAILTPGSHISAADVTFFVQAAEHAYCPTPGKLV